MMATIVANSNTKPKSILQSISFMLKAERKPRIRERARQRQDIKESALEKETVSAGLSPSSLSEKICFYAISLQSLLRSRSEKQIIRTGANATSRNPEMRFPQAMFFFFDQKAGIYHDSRKATGFLRIAMHEHRRQPRGGLLL